MDKETKFVHLGRPAVTTGTAVNPDLRRSTTLLFDQAEDLYRHDILTYGRHGSPLHDHLEAAFNELEGGKATVLTPSGLSACTLAILAFVKSGDHILLSDSIYGPVRFFCLNYLSGLGVETERYEPRIGSDISKLIRKTTTMIIMESPGSLTFEIQDIPAISKTAQKHGITTMVDNTWSAGLTLNPLKLGADISVHSASKHVGGHGDVFGGAVVCRTQAIHKKVAQARKFLGHAVSPDDAYQILRGFRTLVLRFEQQEKCAFELATWLSGRDEIIQVLHPGLPSHPDHALWKRDFTGGGSLFSFVMKPAGAETVNKFINGLKLFGIGFSYGGFESVIIHCDPQLQREFGGQFDGPLVRIGCGLENIDDLKADIKQSLNANF